jgi:hypothetical protein
MNAPPPPPEAAFQEILRGVNIDETTFHIDDTEENRGQESVAIIEDVIDRLNALQQNVSDFNLYRSIADKPLFSTLLSGSFRRAPTFHRWKMCGNLN